LNQKSTWTYGWLTTTWTYHWKMDNYMTFWTNLAKSLWDLSTFCPIIFSFFELFQNELFSVQVYIYWIVWWLGPIFPKKNSFVPFAPSFFFVSRYIWCENLPKKLDWKSIFLYLFRFDHINILAHQESRKLFACPYLKIWELEGNCVGLYLGSIIFIFLFPPLNI